MFGSYKINETATLDFSVENIANRNYLDPIATRAVPSPGLTFRAGMTARFQAIPGVRSGLPSANGSKTRRQGVFAMRRKAEMPCCNQNALLAAAAKPGRISTCLRVG